MNRSPEPSTQASGLHDSAPQCTNTAAAPPDGQPRASGCVGQAIRLPNSFPRVERTGTDYPRMESVMSQWSNGVDPAQIIVGLVASLAKESGAQGYQEWGSMSTLDKEVVRRAVTLFLSCPSVVVDTLRRGALVSEEHAASHARSERAFADWLRDAGRSLGPDAYVSNDGSIQQDLLLAKVPDLVKELAADRNDMVLAFIWLAGQLENITGEDGSFTHHNQLTSRVAGVLKRLQTQLHEERTALELCSERNVKLEQELQRLAAENTELRKGLAAIHKASRVPSAETSDVPV